MSDWMTDEILRTYDVLEQIGEGSGGIVYKAYHRRLQKMVVLKKIIDPNYSAERNRQEVDILKNINHSYLPHVLDFFQTPDGVYTVMDFIPGRSFQEYMKEGARFAKEDLLKWAMQMCSALHYLHTRRIPVIHGDIKPSNIMLKPDGDICLIDFNISFYFNRDTVLGCSRGYSSPEQLWAVSSMRKRQDAPFVIDNKADIYSVGATLYYLATGSVRKDHTQPLDMGKLSARIGRPFAQVIAKAMDLDPAGRYQTAYEMYQALKRVPEMSRRVLKQKRRISRKTVLAAVCAVVILCAGAAAVMMYQDHKSERYNDKIRTAKEQIESGDYKKARDTCEEAISLMDDEAEGYYWKDYTYFVQGDFERCSDELEDDIDRVDKTSLSEDSQRSFIDLYCLQGKAYLEQDKTEAAVAAFAEAEDYSEIQMNAEQYQDYAVALARNGETKKARKKITKAKRTAEENNGSIPEYALSYTEGEILMKDHKESKALDSFRGAADRMREEKLSQEDQYLQYRTYISMYDIYHGRKDWNACISVMEEAEKEVDPTWEAPVRRNLGEAFFQNREYTASAQQYRLVTEKNNGSWSDWRSAARAYHDGGYPQEIFELAQEYEETSGWDEFAYWFLMAYAEMASQNLKSNGYADYTMYRQYYNNAMTAAQKVPGRYQKEQEVLNEFYYNIR